MHAIRVAKHPILNCPHAGARFDILTQEWQDSMPGIKAFRVWFYFNRKTDAEKAFNILLAMVKAINAKTKIIRQADYPIAMLYENQTEDWDSTKGRTRQA